jgi:hypothetical protein
MSDDKMRFETEPYRQLPDPPMPTNERFKNIPAHPSGHDVSVVQWKPNEPKNPAFPKESK